MDDVDLADLVLPVKTGDGVRTFTGAAVEVLLAMLLVDAFASAAVEAVEVADGAVAASFTLAAISTSVSRSSTLVFLGLIIFSINSALRDSSIATFVCSIGWVDDAILQLITAFADMGAVTVADLVLLLFDGLFKIESS